MCNLLIFPVLKSRNTDLRKGCAASRLKTKILLTFQDSVSAQKELEKQSQQDRNNKENLQVLHSVMPEPGGWAGGPLAPPPPPQYLVDQLKGRIRAQSVAG